MTWQQYIKIVAVNPKTALRYMKLGNTLLRKSKMDREAHIASLSPSSQIVYKTALRHLIAYENLFKKQKQSIWSDVDPETMKILETHKPVLFTDENLDESLEDLRIQQNARFFNVGEDLVYIPADVVEEAKKQDKTYLYK